MKGSFRKRHYCLLFLAAVLGVCAAFLEPPRHRAAAIQPSAIAVDEDPPAWDVNAPPVLTKPAPPKSVLPDGPVFVEATDGRFAVQTARYHATLSARNGLIFRPLNHTPPARQARGSAADAPAEFQIRLQRVARGDCELFDATSDPDAADEEAVADDDGVSFWRAPAFEERYQPRGDGVEQSFVLDQRPDGQGPLEFTCELSLRHLAVLPPRAQRHGGLFCVDSDGALAVRYGQVVVRDSDQRGIVIEPQLSADGRSVAFAVPGDWLDSARYPVVVDPLVGTDFLVSPDNTVGVAPPTIAPGNNSFLVVWNDYRAGASLPQLFASIVSTSAIVSPDFPISSAVGLPWDCRFQRIQAAFDGSNWLVVWADDREVGPGIRGSIITPLGEVVGGNDFLIASTAGTVTEDPLVAFNGVDFVVSWLNVPTGVAGSSQVYYARVTSGAVATAATALPSEFAPVNQALLFLAPQRPSGDTLLVYRDNGEDPPQTRSVRIAVDGQLRDPGGTVLFKERVTESGFGRAIGAAWVNTEWHVLSSFDQTTDSSVYLHKITPAGAITPPPGVFVEMGLGPTSLGLDSYAPAFAGAGEWLFVRNEKVNNTVYHLLGKRVTFAGVDKDPVPFQIDTATQGVLRNAVAAQVGSAFLVAWLDGRRSSTQPADAKNIVAAIVDATAAATTGTPLVAVVTASPTSGEAPLSVLFDGSASTGSADTLEWNFGDGTRSTEAKPTHSYRNNGTYLAQLTLTKGAYAVSDTVVITVGTGGTPGPGGGTIVGAPAENSPGMEPRLFVAGASVKLDFSETGKDTARIAGILDVGQLPASLTGVGASVSIGAQNFAFTLDARGSYKSDITATPVVGFTLNAVTGQFAFTAASADMRTAMNALGAADATVKPASIVNIPLAVRVDTLAPTATVGASYTAAAGVSGTANYGYKGAGDEVSGSFIIGKFAASEMTQKTGDKVHNFSIKGQITRPNGGIFRASTTGHFTFVIGNYVLEVPGGQFQYKQGNLKFVARVGTTGLKKFSLDFSSGVFNLQMVKVPAEGAGATNMPLAKSGTNITKVDLALSFLFDLDGGERLNAGRYVYIARKDANAKRWKPR
jgi:hypothetical protein